MNTIVLGGNHFVDCASLLAYRDEPILRVFLNPLRVELVSPKGMSGPDVQVTGHLVQPADRVRVVGGAESAAIFWDEFPLVLGTIVAPNTVNLRLDLRPIGLNIYDDPSGLHIGGNVFSGNHVTRAGTAISLAD